MAKCDICAILENKKEFKFIYEDDKCFAILHESPAITGHTLVIPKKHATILEELNDNIVEHLFITANKVSSAIFESLGAYGTNIILNNGLDAGQELPHVVLNVLPRKEEDSLNFEWPPKKATESELKTTLSMIKLYSDTIFSGKDKLPGVKIKQEKAVEDKEKAEDYLTRTLKRIP
jgi:histidine triad (HIT) family protein